MENIYSSTDFNLACFLYANGLQYKKIEATGNDTKRCSFVFEVPATVNLPELIALWESADTDIVRTVLFKSKLLKTELKKHFELNQLV